MAFKKVVFALIMSLFSTKIMATEITLWSAHESLTDLSLVTRIFEQKTGHKVNVNIFVMEAMRSELLRNANRKTFPDISLVPADFLGLHKELNLRALDKSWGLEEVNSTALQSVQLKGNYYGLPIFVGNHLLLYYNKSLINHPAQSWTEFSNQYSNHLKKEGKKLLAWNYSSIYRLSSFFDAYNAWPLNNGKISLATPEMVNALASYEFNNNLDFVVQDCNSLCALQKMQNEEVAYTISGDWDHNDLYAKLGNKLGIAPLPTVDGKSMKSLSSSFALAVPFHSRNTKVAEAVKEFASFLASQEIQQLIYENYKLLPANQVALKRIQKNAHGNSKVMIDQYLKSFPMPSEYNMSIVWSILRLGYRDLTEQEFTAEEVAQRMQSLANKAIDKDSEKDI